MQLSQNLDMTLAGSSLAALGWSYASARDADKPETRSYGTLNVPHFVYSAQTKRTQTQTCQSGRRKSKLCGQGNGHPRLGKKHTAATRAKIKRNRKPAIFSAETRDRQSRRFSGAGNPFYGKHHKPESLRRGKDSPAYGKQPAHAFKVWYVRKDGSRICFRSTWEARVARYLDQHNVDWQYESQVFPVQYEWNGKIKQSTYRADFWLPETDSFIEVKGLWRTEYLAKYEALRKQYDIKIEVWDRAALEERGIRTGRRSKVESNGFWRK